LGTYEIVAVLRADLDEEALGAALGAINQRITDNGGTVTGLDRWGKRKLAYPIKKHRDGFYALIVFGLDAARIPALRQTLGLQEDVLRLTVSKHYPKPEPAAAARAPAGVAATAHGAAATTQSAGATTTPGDAATTPGDAATTPGDAATTPVTAVPASSTEGTPAPDGDPSHV
jgi:small subunit ribosomal protein S6